MAIDAAGQRAPTDEEQGRLPDAGRKFERWRRTLGLFLGPALALLIFFLTSGLEPPQQKLAAVFTPVITYWISRPYRSR